MIDPMKPFWREAPLSEWEATLFYATMDAHAESARRDNLSTHAVIASAAGSGDYGKAISSALLTLGELHAPLRQAIGFLSTDAPWVLTPIIIATGKRVPGWGTSFIKGEHDPTWDTVRGLLSGTAVGAKMERVTAAMAEAGKSVFPNPGGFTAAVAMVLEMPADIAPYLFLAGRLEVWSDIFSANSTHAQVWEP